MTCSRTTRFDSTGDIPPPRAPPRSRQMEVSVPPNKLWPYALSLFRIIVGALFVCHGAATVFGVLGGTGAGTAAPVGAWPGWWAGLIQLVSGTLVALGLGTRVA